MAILRAFAVFACVFAIRFRALFRRLVATVPYASSCGICAEQRKSGASQNDARSEPNMLYPWSQEPRRTTY